MAWIDDHPVATSAGLAAAIAVAQLLWIRAHRMPGLLDNDEAAYLSGAWRFRSSFTEGGVPSLVEAVVGTSTAPLIPLVSAGLLAVGPDTIWWAMAVQPVLLVLAATSVAALAVRLVPGRLAVIAATVFCAFPGVIAATQSYYYGLAVAAFLGLSLWVLFASDRCRGPAIWWLPPVLAAMVLSRTMALGFVPAVLGAGVALAWGDRRALLRLGAASAVATLLAAPWYLATSETTLSYLLSAGYGPSASQFGTDSKVLQVLAVPAEMALDSGVVLALATVGAALVVLSRGPRRRRDLVRSIFGSSERRALIVALAIGALAVMSTPNRGNWFTLPLLVPATALGAEAIHRLGGTFARATGIVAAALGSAFLLTGLWILPSGRPIPMATQYESLFAPIDERFESPNRDDQPEAAASWSRAYRDTVDAVDEVAPGESPVLLTGNMALFNVNQVELQARLRGELVDIAVPDTTAPLSLLDESLRPSTPGRAPPRALIVVDHDELLLPADIRSREFTERARQAGWTVIRSLPLPSGDVVEILLPPGAPDPD